MDRDELVTLEERGWAALSRGEGRKFYEELLVEDAILIVPGAVLDKQQTLASWDGVAPWQWYELAYHRVVDLDGSAVVIYDVTAQGTGAALPGDHFQHVRAPARGMAARGAPADTVDVSHTVTAMSTTRAAPAPHVVCDAHATYARFLRARPPVCFAGASADGSMCRKPSTIAMIGSLNQSKSGTATCSHRWWSVAGVIVSSR